MQEDPELREAVLDWYKAWDASDIDSILKMSAIGPGFLVIGTDAEEWWESERQLAEVAKAWHGEASVRVRPGKVQAYREGELGFVADRPIWLFPDGTEKELRFTAVLRNEAGGWKFVQSHYSLGVPNEDLIGRKLTI